MKYTQILGYTFFRRRCAADREVCLISIQLRGCNYHTSFALESVQVQESGAREASSVQNNTDAPCLTYQLCGYEGQKLYNTSVMPLEEMDGCLLETIEYIPVRCLYKPTPVAVLGLIKCGCKTSCNARRTTSPALCKCHTSDCSNLPGYRMISDEDDVRLLQEDEQG